MKPTNPAPVFIVLDLETTGLDPHQHEILEVGAISLTGQGLFSEFEDVCIRSDRDNVDAYVMDMHTKNNLWRDCMQKGRPIADVDAHLHQWLVNVGAVPKSVVLIGHSIHFDRTFMNVHMPQTLPLLSHRLRDIGQISTWLAENGVEVPLHAEMPHRSLADCRIELENYRACERAVAELVAYKRAALA